MCIIMSSISYTSCLFHVSDPINMVVHTHSRQVRTKMGEEVAWQECQESIHHGWYKGLRETQSAWAPYQVDHYIVPMFPTASLRYPRWVHQRPDYTHYWSLRASFKQGRAYVDRLYQLYGWHMQTDYINCGFGFMHGFTQYWFVGYQVWVRVWVHIILYHDWFVLERGVTLICLMNAGRCCTSSRVFLCNTYYCMSKIRPVGRIFRREVVGHSVGAQTSCGNSENNYTVMFLKA